MNNRHTRLKTIITLGILLVIATLSLRNFITRGLWWDEALTVMEFVSYPSSYLGIYKNYTIPNNHILFSCFMRFWLDDITPFFRFSIPMFRLPSVIASLFFVLFSFLFWRKYSSSLSVFFVILLFVISPVFSIYAVAVRGYAFSILFVSLAIPAVLASCENRKIPFIFYCFLSIISVGIMPNNVLAIFAVSLLPFVIGEKKLNLKNLFKFSSVPFLSLIIFYMPISGRFLKTISIEEGWNSKMAAAAAFYLSVMIISAPLILIASKALKWKQIKYGQKFFSVVAIFAIPAVFFASRSPSPFPRTFVSFLPLWFFLFSFLIAKVEKEIFLLYAKKMALYLASAVILSSAVYSEIIRNRRSFFSSVIFASGQDDFFEPYFVKPSFQPDMTIRHLVELVGIRKGIIFVDSNSDPYSLFFSAKLSGLGSNFIVFDNPRAKILLFPSANDGSSDITFIVAPDQDRANQIAKRFGLKIISLNGGFGSQKIFKAISDSKFNPHFSLDFLLNIS